MAARAPAAAAAALLVLALAAAATASAPAGDGVAVPATLEGLKSLPRRDPGDRCKPEHRALMTKCDALVVDAWARHAKTGAFAGTTSFRQLESLVERQPDLASLMRGANRELMEAHMVAGISSRLTCYRALGNAEVDDTLSLHPDCFRVGSTGTSCLFLHGGGFKAPDRKHRRRAGEDARFLDSFAGDFGDAGEHLREKRLCDPIFYSTDTLDRGWESGELQEELCAVVAAVQPDLLFSNSETSLALAAGAARGLAGCKRIGRGAADTHWYTSMAPFRGAPVKFVEQVCRSCTSYLAETKGFQWLYNNKLTSVATCSVVKGFYRHNHCHKAGNIILNKYRLYPAFASLQEGFVNQRSAYDSGARSPSLLETRMSRSLQIGGPRGGRRTPRGQRPASNEPGTPQLRCGEEERAVAGPPCETLGDVAERLVMGEMCGLYTLMTTSPATFLEDANVWVAERAFAVSSHVIGSDWGGEDDKQRPPHHGNDGFVAAHSCMLQPGKFAKSPESLHYAVQTHHWGARCSLKAAGNDPKLAPCAWQSHTVGNSKARLLYELAAECAAGCDEPRRRLHDVLKARTPQSAVDAFAAVAQADGDKFEKELEQNAGREELEHVVDDFIAALDDNRDRAVSVPEFQFWQVVQGGQLRIGVETVVYASFDVDLDGHVTTAEVRQALEKLLPTHDAVHAATDRLREWHADIVRLTLRAGGGSADSVVGRLVRERRWRELVRDLYGAFVRAREAGAVEAFRERFALSNPDVDTLESAHADGVLVRLAEARTVELYEDHRSKNRPLSEIARDFFVGIDTDFSGALSRDEVSGFLASCGGFCVRGGRPAFEDVDKLMATGGWDTDGSGTVSAPELETAVSHLGVNELWEVSAGVRDAGVANRAAVRFADAAGDVAVASSELLRWVTERKFDFVRAEYRRVVDLVAPAGGGDAGGGDAGDGSGGGGNDGTGGEDPGSLRNGLPETMLALVETRAARAEPLDAASLHLIASFRLPLHFVRDLKHAPSPERDTEVRTMLAEVRRDAREEATSDNLEQTRLASARERESGTATAAQTRANEAERMELAEATGRGGQALA